MKNDIKFEEAINLLENEVKKLENGNLTLDEAIASYENAIKLAGICNKKLESAEQKVYILTSSNDGTISDAPFEVNNNET